MMGERKHTVLQMSAMPLGGEPHLEDHFNVVDLHDLLENRDPEILRSIKGIATTAKGPIDAELIGILPNLQIIASYSAGTDGIDVTAARERGIPVTTTSQLIAPEVANLAIGLILAVSRRIAEGDRYVRHGMWSNGPMPLGNSLDDCRLGIVGMGNIGRAVANKARPFFREICYFGPHRKTDLPYSYHSDIIHLARHCDYLVICCPATPRTRNLIGAEALAALGTNGYLVNVARGSIVDEDALIEAIARKTIAGAGLDVFAREPDVPEILRQSDRVVLLPHVGAATAEIRRAMAQAMVRSLIDHIN